MKKVSYKMERICRGATTGVQLVQFPHFFFQIGAQLHNDPFLKRFVAILIFFAGIFILT